MGIVYLDMESITRVKFLEDRISNLLQPVTKLKEENDRLAEENCLLKEELAQVKSKLDEVENNAAQYLTEQDGVIIERIEGMLSTIDMVEKIINKHEMPD